MNDDEIQAGAEATGTSQPSETPTQRLVIRVRIVPEEPQRVAGRGTLDKRRIAIALAVTLLVAVTLIWVLTSVFKGNASSSSSAGPASSTAPTSGSATPAVEPTESEHPHSPEPSSTIDHSQSGSRSPSAADPTVRETTEAEAQEQAHSDPAPSPIDEVIPSVPQSALQTIRGTVRVAIRVVIAPDGTVLSTTPEIPGPSRYFERLSREAAQKWTFTPASTQEQRVMRIRFFYTQDGARAHAEPPE